MMFLIVGFCLLVCFRFIIVVICDFVCVVFVCVTCFFENLLQ